MKTPKTHMMRTIWERIESILKQNTKLLFIEHADNGTVQIVKRFLASHTAFIIVFIKQNGY